MESQLHKHFYIKLNASGEQYNLLKKLHLLRLLHCEYLSSPNKPFLCELWRVLFREMHFLYRSSEHMRSLEQENHRSLRCRSKRVLASHQPQHAITSCHHLLQPIKTERYILVRFIPTGFRTRSLRDKTITLDDF